MVLTALVSGHQKPEAKPSQKTKSSTVGALIAARMMAPYSFFTTSFPASVVRALLCGSQNIAIGSDTSDISQYDTGSSLGASMTATGH